jgi:adenine/guanine phosphoribosyltransferase-like PRPP-binding protein
MDTFPANSFLLFIPLEIFIKTMYFITQIYTFIIQFPNEKWGLYMTDTTINKRYISYDYFGALADRMVDKLKDERFTKVYGPPRGGLPLAVHMAHHLNLPLVISEEFLSNMNKWSANDRLLVVDDIINNGKIISGLSQLLTIRKINHFTAVMFYKPHAIFKPDLYMEKTEDWIIFPWERADKESGA